MEQVEPLITKARAAEIMSVSKRTIDNWIANGTLPMPTTIGRKVYWHPADFSQWQNRLFERNTENTGVEHAPQRPRGRPRNPFTLAEPIES